MFFYELQVTFHNSFFTNPFWGTACEIFCLLRSSRSEVFCKKGVVRNFEKFIGKHLCQSLLFNKVAGLRLCNRCFPLNFSNFRRTPWKIPIYIIHVEMQASFSEAVNWRNIFPRNHWCYLTFSEHVFSQNTSVAASEFKCITIYSEIVISKCSQ